MAQQSEFLDLSEDTVRTLLESDTLECGEEVAFAALMSWIKKDEGSRAEALERLVPLIRFPQMLPADLSAVCTEPLLGNLPASLLMPLMAGEHDRLQTILALRSLTQTAPCSRVRAGGASLPRQRPHEAADRFREQVLHLLPHRRRLIQQPRHSRPRRDRRNSRW